MSWDYRVVKRKVQVFGNVTDTYAIHECYYADGIERSISVDPVNVDWCESLEELEDTLKLMQKASDKPLLDYEDF